MFRGHDFWRARVCNMVRRHDGGAIVVEDVLNVGQQLIDDFAARMVVDRSQLAQDTVSRGMLVQPCLYLTWWWDRSTSGVRWVASSTMATTSCQEVS